MRVTVTMLKNRVAFLNKNMNRPTEYFKHVEAGKNQTNAGHFCIDSAYGGYALHEVCNEVGGVVDVFNSGHIPARDLLNLLCAFETGMRYAKQD